MKRTVLATLFGAATALLAVVGQANASVMLYSDAYSGYGDYAAFQAATHSTAYTFSNVPSATYDTLQVGPATFSTVLPQQIRVGPGTDGVYGIGLRCRVICGDRTINYIDFKPSDQSYAVGLVIDGSQTQASNYRVFINGVEFASPATDPGYPPEALIEDAGHLFYGFVSDVPIATVAITSFHSQGDGEDLIQFNVGAPVEIAVPEPASWTMMAGGIGLAALALRRRRIPRGA